MRLRALLAPAAALLLAAAGCAQAPSPPAAAPQRDTPALWKLSDPDTEIYLFGTIHVLPPGHAWQSPAFRQVVAKADRLVIETLVDNDPHTSAAMLLGLGRSEGLPPLLERVAPEKRPLLADIVARSKLPPALLDGLETWTAALMLVTVPLADLGVDPANGVEAQLKAAFAAAGKPVDGLETPAQQLAFLDGLSEKDQRSFLESLIEDPEKGRRDFAEMLAAWSRGDEAAIARTFDDEPGMSPELRDVLLARRNAEWTAWLQRRLDQPGTILVAVGAGHLAGHDSVQTLLAAKGLKVERVQ